MKNYLKNPSNHQNLKMTFFVVSHEIDFEHEQPNGGVETCQLLFVCNDFDESVKYAAKIIWQVAKSIDSVDVPTKKQIKNALSENALNDFELQANNGGELRRNMFVHRNHRWIIHEVDYYRER